MTDQDIEIARRTAERWIAAIQDERDVAYIRELMSDDKDLVDQFSRNMEFGTAGMRGIMDLGPFCMNAYTVAAAVMGIGRYLKKQNKNKVVLAYDARINSQAFAKLALRLFSQMQINVVFFDVVAPTPVVPFVLLHGGADLGLMITASHNPPEYNGLKVYAANGVQFVSPVDKEISAEINAISIEEVAGVTYEEAEVAYEPGKPYFDEYIQFLKQKVLLTKNREISVVYTPLHGAAGELMMSAFRGTGFKNVQVVEAQFKPHGDFPTVSAPNPEYTENLSWALKDAQKIKADMVLANDGDGDRIGVIVRSQSGEYSTLDGNQIGCLLAYYILSQRQLQGKLTGKELLISTVVSSPLLQKIAEGFGVAYRQTLTGFKWMGTLAAELETQGLYLVLAYEEAFGVAVGGARDKDGISAALLLAEAAAHSKLSGSTLLDVLDEIYTRFGRHHEGAYEEYYAGTAGMQAMARVLDSLRESPPSSLAGQEVIETIDYFTQKRHTKTGTVSDASLPVQNMLYLKTKHGCWMAVRPSGTEPKVKAYFGAVGDSAEKIIKELHESAVKILRL